MAMSDTRTLHEAIRATDAAKWRMQRSRVSTLTQAERAVATPPLSGSRRVCDVSPAEVREAVTKWQEVGLSASTINKRLCTLNAIGIDVSGMFVPLPRRLKWWLTPDFGERLQLHLRTPPPETPATARLLYAQERWARGSNTDVAILQRGADRPVRVAQPRGEDALAPPAFAWGKFIFPLSHEAPPAIIRKGCDPTIMARARLAAKSSRPMHPPLTRGQRNVLLADYILWATTTGLRVEETLNLTRANFRSDFSAVEVRGTKTARSHATLPLSLDATVVASRVFAGRDPAAPEHFAQSDAPRETVWLTHAAERDYASGTVDRKLIDYADTSETTRFRTDMATINTALQSAKMHFISDGGAVVLTGIRHLRRHFNSADGSERFDHGGRLFGGWWQDLPRDRRHAIRLDREPVADLDFAAMFLRLAYLEAGLTPPEGDNNLYAVPGFADAAVRAGVKTAASAMLFRTSPMVRLPKDAKALLPPGTPCARVRSAILAAHPGLAGVFETGIGMRFMFLESQILVAAMLRLIGEGVTALLPMHDGIMVPGSKAAQAVEAMRNAAEIVVGFRLPVADKSLRMRPQSRSP